MFPKIAGKFPKKSEQFSKIQRYSIKFFMLMPRLPNGRSFALIYLFIISFILIRKRFFLSHIYRNRLFRLFLQNIKHIEMLTPNIFTNTIDI